MQSPSSESNSRPGCTPLVDDCKRPPGRRVAPFFFPFSCIFDIDTSTPFCFVLIQRKDCRPRTFCASLAFYLISPDRRYHFDFPVFFPLAVVAPWFSLGLFQRMRAWTLRRLQSPVHALLCGLEAGLSAIFFYPPSPLRHPRRDEGSPTRQVACFYPFAAFGYLPPLKLPLDLGKQRRFFPWPPAREESLIVSGGWPCLR